MVVAKKRPVAFATGRPDQADFFVSVSPPASERAARSADALPAVEHSAVLAPPVVEAPGPDEERFVDEARVVAVTRHAACSAA
jgi:hypothetical protein